jgi:transposase-like protein
MATLKQLDSNYTRANRYFSEEFKKKKVTELDKKITSISEICREYEVSAPAVYKWIYKFSNMRKKGLKMVVEAESDTTKILELKKHISQMEQLLGQKQFEIEFLQKQMEIASEQYGIDLKKKLTGKRSAGFGSRESNTITK